VFETATVAFILRPLFYCRKAFDTRTIVSGFWYISPGLRPY